MSKFDYKNVMPRYSALAILMTVVAIAVLGKAIYIMTAKHDFWMAVADRVKVDSLEVKPQRGNILSTNGELMASSLPEYKLYIDFKAIRDSENDTLWMEKEDSICKGLAAIFPGKTAAEFRKHLEEGRSKQSRHWAIWPRRVDYNTYAQVRELPVLRLSPIRGGFHVEAYDARQRPYGTLASRTVGDLYGAKDLPRYGLELSYDSLLRGTNGIVHKRKVLNKYLKIMDTPPVDGYDIVTTIDVGMQDLAERALIQELKKKEVNGNVGVAIVMEVATGDIKAIVNMEKCADGEYREIKNHAVSDLLEPGSVFKAVSILVALDDGVVDTTYRVDTGNGQWPMYGRVMKDHNWHRGGYGMMTLPRTLEVSSNIGVSRIIDDHYREHPEKFVEGVHRTGIADDLHIPLVGSSPAIVRYPKKNKRGQYTNWYKTTLPWMSIGYETQVPPISTLTFYNAIANGGKMMRPRFVKQVIKDGEVIKEFPPVVQREQIAKPATIKIMQTILTHVVSQGLGRKAGSTSFAVAGKTGTAQISQGASGYRAGGTHYLLSFAGFFPADNPRYSCIVCIQKYGLPASGGGMSGVVFHDIAEGIMAQSLKVDVRDARDPMSVMMPDVKNGNMTAAGYVLSHLGIKTNTNWGGSYADGNPYWGHATKQGNSCVNLYKARQTGPRTVPDVTGMGARDAVFLLEKRGLIVRLYGRGRVTKQSIEPGKPARKGQICELHLE